MADNKSNTNIDPITGEPLLASKYFNKGTRAKPDYFGDVSETYVDNPTPQARYAISKASNEGHFTDIGKYGEATVKGPKSVEKFLADRQENLRKIGREADNEMKREGSRMHPSMDAKRKGGKITAKKMASGGKVSSASKRADGIAAKGKTKGRIV